MQCNHKFDGNSKCTTPHITEEKIKEYFVKAANILISKKADLTESFNEIKDIVFDTSELEQRIKNLKLDMDLISDKIRLGISENAQVAKNQAEYKNTYDILVKKFNQSEKQLAEAEKELAEKQGRKAMTEQFLNRIDKPESIIEYSDELWYSLIDYVTIYSKEDIRFTFKNGMEIKL